MTLRFGTAECSNAVGWLATLLEQRVEFERVFDSYTAHWFDWEVTQKLD